MDNLGVIVALGFSLISIVVCMITMFVWTRQEANKDRRYQQDSVDRIKKDLDKMYWRVKKLSDKD